MANEFKVKKGLIVDGTGTVLDIQGTQGQLFSITDSLTGDIFAVSDISGVPILNVNSSGLVTVDGDLNVTESVTANNTFISENIDGNPTPNTNQLRLSGYGIIGNRGAIYMTNSNSVGELRFGIGGIQGQGTKLTITSSDSIFTGGVRGTIFYDNDNTSYYSDPASTTHLNLIEGNYVGIGMAANSSGSYRLNMAGSINMNDNHIDYVNGLHFNDNVRFYDDGNNSYLNFKYGNADAGGIKIYNGGGTLKGFIYGSDTGFGLLDNDGQWALRTQTGTNPLELRCNNNLEFEVYDSYTVSSGSSRAPIFYDSNDTNYFTNPASTSNLNGLTVNATISGTTSGNVKQLNTSSGDIDADWGTSFKTFDPIPTGTPPIQSPNLRTINIGENFSRRTQLAFNYATDQAWFRRKDSVWHTWREFIHSGNIGTQTVANATNMLPLVGGTLTGSLTVGSGQTNSNIYMADSDGTARRIHTNSNRIGFLTSGNGWGSYCSNNGDWTTDMISYAGASMRTPIFYDSNNTTYYINPAGESIVQRITHINHTTPILIKVNSGYRSWVHHVSTSSTYHFAPSATNGAEDWDWANQMSINTSGVVTANNFVLSSDKRSKTKIEDLTGDNVDVSWKSFEMKGNEGEYRTGVIAQELEENHPEFVNTDEKGFKSVKYIDLLIAKIAELEARLEKLEK